MKVGVKIWPDKAEYAYEIAEHADFMEIMARRGCDFSFLKDIDLPFVVHAEHEGIGVNYCDSANTAISEESLQFAIKLADELGSKIIIVHGGKVGGPTENQQTAVDFLKKQKDGRIIIENLLFREQQGGRTFEHPFSTFEGMRDLLLATSRSMCLDFSHAHITSCFTGENYIDLLQKFISMSPRHFHACGGVEGQPEDSHSHVWEGNLNIGAFKRMLPRGAWVTLETPTDLEGQIKDIEIMKS
jgi:endonuclease IV